MKQITIKSALMLTVAVILLTMGTASASAQYYMNIFPKNGQKIRYVVADLDSINFSDQSESIDDYEYVDLGLSVNWATHNVGAERYVEDYGNYYAWGETKTKSEFSWSTYKYSNNAGYVTKYCNDSNKGYNGFVDYKTTLDPIDDVANMKWGGDWRMPTIAEFNELQRNCEWLWTTQNGINGYKVTSKLTGYTDRSIFLPAAGVNGDNANPSGSSLAYWTSTLSSEDPSGAQYLYYHTDGNVAMLYSPRYNGQSVRPVKPSEEWKTKETIYVLNKEELTIIFPENNYSLYITPYKGSEDVSEIIPVSVKWKSENPSIATVDENGIVTGISLGTATITASMQDFSASCIVTVKRKENGSENGYQYIELGLSVKWASLNVGASKPEEYGDYYAWGETETKTDYSWSTYKWCNGSYTTMTKYCNNSSYGNNGFTDTKTTLDPDNDVAHVKWGGSWRMPIKAEQDELHNSCTWTWYSSGNTEFNGVAGYKVTSNVPGYTDRFIFLPAAGYRSGTGLSGVGSFGSCLSSSLYTGNPSGAWSLDFDSDGVNRYDYGNRGNGFSVRPVCP